MSLAGSDSDAERPSETVSASLAAALTVVVLQWGRADETIACLSALRRSRGVTFGVLVVDNPSAEADTADRVAAAHPWVEVLRNGANLGFAGGNNVALERLVAARAAGRAPRYALVLNNDVEVEPDCIAELLAVARRRDAAVTGAINFLKGTRRVGSSAGELVWPSASYRDVGAASLAAGEAERRVDVVSGSTFLCDLDALETVGVFDPAYFCVYEETDLCARLRAAGHTLWLAPRAHAHHAVGASTGRRLHFYFRYRNRVRFVRRNGGDGAVMRMLPGYMIDVLRRCVTSAVLLRPREVHATLRGAWHGLRGVRGPGPYVDE